MYYTFENTTAKSDAFFDLFDLSIANVSSLTLYPHIVTNDEAGRLHAVSKTLHGTEIYVEELMVINNLYNPHSINVGDVIYYCDDVSEYKNMYKRYKEDTSDTKDIILNKNKSKSTSSDPNRIGYAPTIKPDNIKQLNVDYTNKQIKIINKLS